MPKMKTHTGAKKRFKLSSTGKIRRKHAYTSHCLGDAKKSKKQKRFLGQTANVHVADVPNIRKLLNS